MTALALTASTLIYGIVGASILALVVCIPLLIHKEKNGKEGETTVEPKTPPDWDWPAKNYLKGK